MGVRGWGVLLVVFVIVEVEDLGIRTGTDMSTKERKVGDVDDDVEVGVMLVMSMFVSCKLCPYRERSVIRMSQGSKISPNPKLRGGELSHLRRHDSN